MLNKIEIIFWKFAKWLIRRDYGICYEEVGMEDCLECQANKVIEWIDKHIRVINY